MKRNEIVSFALKILGIFCIIFAVMSLENLMAYAIYITGDSAGKPIDFAHLLFYASVPFTILLLSGILLIKYSVNWSTKFWPADDKVTTQTGISYDEVQIIGFSIIGLLVLAFSVPKFFKIIVALVEGLSGFRQSTYVFSLVKDIVFVLVQISIGIYLFIGSTGLNKLWKQIQKTRG